MSALWWCILYIVSIFLVFLSICFISSSLRLIIPKLYLNTGTANAPIAVIIIIIIIIIIIMRHKYEGSTVGDLVLPV
jgi:hypothetical protein